MRGHQVVTQDAQVPAQRRPCLRSVSLVLSVGPARELAHGPLHIGERPDAVSHFKVSYISELISDVWSLGQRGGLAYLA
jgi:hypothetical protein